MSILLTTVSTTDLFTSDSTGVIHMYLLPIYFIIDTLSPIKTIVTPVITVLLESNGGTGI